MTGIDMRTGAGAHNQGRRGGFNVWAGVTEGDGRRCGCFRVFFRRMISGA